MIYRTRNHAFAPATTWVLDEAGLRLDADQGPSRRVPWAEVASVRLEFAPTRPERNRYRCRLALGNGSTVEFFNRTYRGVYDFADTTADYVAFVRALLMALTAHAPQCRFVAGAGAANYALGVAGFLVAAGAVLLTLVFSITVGLWWLVLIKAALIVFYFPTAWQWLRRNREQTFAPASPPAEVLPAMAEQSARP